jgi:hypothetical protein
MVVEFPSKSQQVEISVTDISGRVLIKQGKILTNGKTELDVSSLRSGIYILKAESQSQQITTKFLVNP